MRKLCIIILSLICNIVFAQDKLVVIKKDGSRIETRTALIDSITFPVGTTMRIYNWDDSKTDIALIDVDSLSLIPDKTSAGTDRDALIALYNATNGPNWTNSTNWCSDKPLNEWYGVITNLNGRVYDLNLGSNQLAGSLPPELGRLTKLEKLSLLNNQLSGNIPAELGQLSNLKVLWLYYNKLSGSIPLELSQLTNLQDLNLIFNQLTGTIPSELSHLSNLQELSLSNNKLTGSIPSELSKLSELTSIYLGDNQLTGNIPTELGQLKNLLHLYLKSNQLSGSIPREILKLHNLHLLSLHENNITGVIPSEFTNVLTNVSKYSVIERNYHAGLDLTLNRISGIIPYSIVSHPKWSEFSRLIVPQQTGYKLEPATVILDSFTVEDIDGQIIDTSKLISLNKLTVIHRWSSTCGPSGAFIPVLKNVYQAYSDKGLGVISFHAWAGGDEQTVRDYIKNNQMTWDNVMEKSPFSQTPANLIPFLQGLTTPSVDVINQDGEVVFSNNLWNNLVDFEKFIASQLGPVQFYESKDYSKDGLVTKLQNATIGAGVNIILMGDAFVDTTFVAGGLYEERMREAMENFFSVEPTKSYRQYFNVYTVNAVSKNGFYQYYTETVFSAKFGQNTWVDGDMTKISQYAQKVEGINSAETHLIIVLNTPRYAGTCYLYDDASVAFTPVVASDPKEFAAVIHHEAVGHGLGKLGDEYIYYDATINETDRASLVAYQLKGWYQNLSISSTALPWGHFTGKPNYSMVSAYEGGFYFSNGVWRPEQNSCMNNNMPYFNAPSREQIVKRVLQTAGVAYSWDEFVKNDKFESVKGIVPTIRPIQEKEHLAPPVIMNRRLFLK